ncbi:WD40 repeat-like protein [Russula earlei]|uniref:WD40 repeat-like protein n=1 Tax=Russula earlei TaxID=71964 RepID=A0ACC0UNT9_9AGAM|nr:WD40 repeat-like protein [Russula earlei]
MSSSASAAPPPLHIIRAHSSAISALFISDDNERLYSGDTSGSVAITSTRSLRPLASWAAHADGLLGVQEWGGRGVGGGGKQVITHGRDNKLHVWRLPSPSRTPSTVRGSVSAAPDMGPPELGYSLDVNALNFCRFSLLPLAPPRGPADPRALLAVPNLADIWALPSKERIHAAVGRNAPDAPMSLGSDGRGAKNATGIIMSMHLLSTPVGATIMDERALSLITSYEDGSVKLWRYRNVEKERSIEGVGWECLWSFKLHVESVMATAVSPDHSIVMSVSADHLVGRYDLKVDPTANAGTAYRTKHPGNGAVAFHDDGRVCAIGGWDGRVRLFSTTSLKPLGTLIYHKAAVQALAFARASPLAPPPDRHRHRHRRHDDLPPIDDEDEEEDEEDEMTAEEKLARSRWLVSGGKDGRVVIWALRDFRPRV